jgi:hypothetical protein
VVNAATVANSGTSRDHLPVQVIREANDVHSFQSGQIAEAASMAATARPSDRKRRERSAT